MGYPPHSVCGGGGGSPMATTFPSDPPHTGKGVHEDRGKSTPGCGQIPYKKDTLSRPLPVTRRIYDVGSRNPRSSRVKPGFFLTDS